MDNLTPFSISPNPNSLFLSEPLKAVLQKSRFVVQKRQGLSCIIGDVGLGKSTILRYLWAEFAAREDFRTIFLPTPDFPSKFALLKAISTEFGLEPQRSSVAQLQSLQQFLFDQFSAGKNVVLFIDEAQNLNNDQLELLRTLLNFETSEQKTIQIVLAGQVELKNKLDSKKNKYLKSRIVMYSALSPLSLEEAEKMILKRCEDFSISNPFTAEMLEKIYLAGGGVPRSLLKLCAYLYELKQQYELDEIPIEFIEQAASEVAL